VDKKESLLKDGELHKALSDQLEKVHQEAEYANQIRKILTDKNEHLLSLKNLNEDQLKKLRSEVADLSLKLKEQTHRYTVDTERLA
jgi:Tfp pilus assembly protein PilO